MGCSSSHESDVANEQQPTRSASENYIDTSVGAENMKKKGILSSTTRLSEYRNMMKEVGAVGSDEEIDCALVPADDDDTCDAVEVRLSDINSASDRGLETDRDHSQTSLFEVSNGVSASATSTPNASFLTDTSFGSGRRSIRRSALEIELPGTIDSRGRKSGVSFTSDTPFVEGKALPVSKRVKALQLLKQSIQSPTPMRAV